jgi:outer membrane protein insertion porin family
MSSKNGLIIIFLGIWLIFSSLTVLAVENSQEAILEGKISKIEISGNYLLTDEDIKKAISSYPGMQISREIIIEDLKKIFSLGYFPAQGVSAKPFQLEDGSILLEFVVTENPPISDLIVYGNYSNSGIDAYSYFSDLIGKPENTRAISDKIQALEQDYFSKGFIVARVKDIDLDPSGRLKIFIDEGIISEIVYTGNTKTKTSFLNHLVSNTSINEPYNELDFSKDFKKLKGIGFFNNVNRVVRPSETDNGYVLEIQLQEKEKYTSLGIGGGVNSSAGIFGNATLAVGNIKGKGETLNVNALLGSGLGAGSTLNTNSNFVRRGRFTSINATYSIPYFHDTRYTLTNTLNLSRGPNFTVDLSRQTSANLGTGISRGFGDNHVFRLNANANYVDVQDRDREQYISDVANNIVELDQLSDQDVLNYGGTSFLGGRMGIARAEARKIRDEQIVKGFYFGISPTYSYADLDDPTKPRSGWRSRFGLNPNLGVSEINSYTKLSGSATKYIPIGEKSSFIFNARGGYELFGDIPQFDKYRLGTSTGVRGYRQFSQLGVGNKLLISTSEFRTPLYNIARPLKKYKWSKNLDFAVFADAGMVGGDIRLNRVTDRLSQAASVGFGIRVNLPLVGALRFDIGFPLVAALVDDKLFRLNFGPADFY